MSVDPEQLLAEWSTLRVGAGMDHLDSSCRKCPDHYRRVTAEQYPPSHVNLCSLCAARFRRWRDAINGPGGDCERCGGETSTPPEQYDEMDLCDDCYQQVSLRR